MEQGDGAPRHHSYQKIASDPADWRLTLAGQRELDRLEWVVTEKIHGANFCLTLGPQSSITCAKRKAPLGAGESFFAHERLLARLEAQLEAARRAVVAALPDAEEVLIYGELFGGGYPHPEVAAVEGVQPVQTGVWYSPDVELCVFDLAWRQGPDDAPRWVDFAEAMALLGGYDLLCAEPLLVGSLHEALGHEARFETTIPARLGLPPIEGNLAEGVVIRPAVASFVETSKGVVQPLLKRKIPEFTEDARYHQAVDWSRHDRPPSQDPALWALDLLEWEIEARLNPNRLQAAISKVGPRPDGPQQGWEDQLAAEVAEDVWQEIAEGFGDSLQALEREEMTLLREVLEAQARELGAP